MATPECSVSPCVRAPPPPQIQCLAQGLALNSMLCMFPTLCLRNRRHFHQNLKMAVDDTLAAAQQGAEKAGEGSGPSKSKSWGLARPGFGPNGFY